MNIVKWQLYVITTILFIDWLVDWLIDCHHNCSLHWSHHHTIRCACLGDTRVVIPSYCTTDLLPQTLTVDGDVFMTRSRPHFSPRSGTHMCNRHDITNMMVDTLGVQGLPHSQPQHSCLHTLFHPNMCTTPTGRSTKKLISSFAGPCTLAKNRLGV